MRPALLILVPALALATPEAATAADAPRVRVELTCANHDVHPVSDDTGRVATDWNTADDAADLAEGRVTVRLGLWEVIGQVERMPRLDRELGYSAYEPRGQPPAFTPVTTTQTESTSLDSFDLALGRGFEPGAGVRLTPWAGVCYVRTTLDTRATQWWNEAAAGGGAILPILQTTEVESSGSYLGAVTGGEVSFTPAPRLSLVGRVAARWVGGHLSTTATAERVVNVPSGESVTLPPTLETSQSWRLILAADAGLEWRAADHLSLAAGWRLRDYSFDAGPASLDGPFLRLAASF